MSQIMRESPPTRHWLEILYHNLILPRHVSAGAITASKVDFTTLGFGNYTTTEVDTGFTWVNGKAIYKITKTGTTTAAANTNIMVTGIAPAFKQIISIEGYFGMDGTNFVGVDSTQFSSGDTSIFRFVSSYYGVGEFRLRSGMAWTSRPYAVTFWYTKV